jgi:hypothetical protein
VNGFYDGDDNSLVVNLKHDPVIANTSAPKVFVAGHFSNVADIREIFEVFYGSSDAVADSKREPTYIISGSS